MWIKSAILKNIKSFREQQIDFTGPGAEEKPSRWITLLGENGVGKSALLQAMALLLAGPEAAKELLPDPIGWVRSDGDLGKISATVESNGEMPIHKSGHHSYSYFITGNKAVSIGGETYPHRTIMAEDGELLKWLRLNAFPSDSNGWFACGYGPFRRLMRSRMHPIPSLDGPKRSSNFVTLFNNNRPLSTFEEWMVHLDYRLAKNPQDSQAGKMWEVGEKVITRLLPGEVKIAEVTVDGLIWFTIDGQKVPSISLSDGFCSIIALGGDLIWHLLQAFPLLEDPTQASGVVLIDELDIHLHPAWQRQIADRLQEVFPNLQFFVATHSPLVAAGAGEEALTLRLDLVDGETRVTPIEDISAYDVRYILTSPAFGLESTHSPGAKNKIMRYHELRRKENQLKLVAGEREEYQQLRKFIKEKQPIDGPPEPGSLRERMQDFLEEALR